jgi:hypothetical protein
MTGRIYMSFSDVERDVRLGSFTTEPELRQAFVEALKNEVVRYCRNEDLVKYVFTPLLDRVLKERRRADIRFSNVVIEVEKPGGDLSQGREQLYRYMKDLKSQVRGLMIYGVVTNGFDAEYYALNDDNIVMKMRGGLSQVMNNLLTMICSQKISIISPEDLVEIFGV